MRVSLNWLRELVEIDLTPEELGRTLTIAGFEVEEIEDLRQNADGVVVGKVIDCEPHPNADKLRVTKVDIGAESPLNIVCGAANVKTDIFVPVATVGTYLPTVNLKLKPTKLRGVRSEGMICSLSELGLEKQSDGIHIFASEGIEIGQDVRPLLGLDDVILDLSTTANRADALSMVGVAREVVALTGSVLKLPEVREISISDRDNSLSLKVVDTNACPAYIGTIIEGITIAPSPDWLQWRLQAAGVRPINNVVDITNYILLEWGQPLHAFDRERLQDITGTESLTIGVRYASEGEKLTTLDGQERSLKTDNLLITANDKPVALAGVMGGEESEVHQESKNIVLEAALFDSVVVRKSSRAAGLRSEASTRYERGVNEAEYNVALNRAIALIIELAGGKAIAQAVVDDRDLDSSRCLQLRLSRINEILGPVKLENGTGQIEAEDVEKILIALGCKLEKIADRNDVWQVTPPPYRHRDLEREIDLIEEVARLYGYDNFCDELPDKTEAGYLSVREIIGRKIREAFRSTGLTEICHYSLVKPEDKEIVLANPLFSEYSALRTDLISGLIDAFEYNQSQGNGALNAFEIGRIFWREGEELKEADAVAGILGGDLTAIGRWTRAGKGSPMTWYQAKGILESAFSRLGLTVEYRAEKEDKRLHPGRTASLWIEKQRLGIFGQLHPQLRQEKNTIDEVYVFQISFDIILASLNKEEVFTPRFKSYSTYPAVERDLAFFADVSIPVFQIEQAIKKSGGSILAGVELFDEYQGENVPEGERSLAFSLYYRASDRTLTDKEIEPVHQKVRDTLVKQFSANLRS
ncbi:MAG: phenylalanine--tRNA ligase subunit beta [Prochloraceae cyanobacterium]|nr:phenylalanine--tRNA ligase subunit beta [Prochloraceae cyanobacterium]